MAKAPVSVEADSLCGAAYGERSNQRANHRNGYRKRGWDTRADTVELVIPKLRRGLYFPEWLLERRRRVEQTLIRVVATSYLLGSTRRVDTLVEQLGINDISTSQVSAMATVLDEQAEGPCAPALGRRALHPLWGGRPHPEDPQGRTVNVACPGRHRGKSRRAARDPQV